MASPNETTAMRQSTRNGPMTEPADSCSKERRPKPTRAHPFGVPEAHDLEEPGQRARREEIATDQGEEEAHDQGDAESLLLVAGQ